jgi:poly-beta-1,6-N-acetyl-D-glucosamine N-deacetylase
MEEADDARQFYDKIVHNVKQEKCGLERTVMELQTVNWRKENEPISSVEMADTLRHLYDLGVHHIAYYPDNVFTNTPDADTMKQAFTEKALRMHSFTPSDIVSNK